MSQEENEQNVEVVEFSHPGEDKKFHHTFDGIEEYDNPMPGWWVNVFWVTIVFSVFYFGYYHLSGRASDRIEDYNHSLAMWEIKRAKVRAEFAKLPLEQQFKKAMADSSNIEKGRKIFVGKGICHTCHAPDGGGLIGPNLTDNYWINGPKPERKQGPKLRDIFRIVTYGGRKGKQMQAYEKTLSPMERVQVSLYVASLRGKKTAKPKPKLPEAKKYEYITSPVVP